MASWHPRAIFERSGVILVGYELGGRDTATQADV